jgi:hypothetical protein
MVKHQDRPPRFLLDQFETKLLVDAFEDRHAADGIGSSTPRQLRRASRNVGLANWACAIGEKVNVKA